MKKNVLLMLAACAALGLASCGRSTPASSSQPSESSANAASSSADSTVYATDLTVDAATLALKIDETHQIVATVAPANVTTGGVTYASSAADVASVSDTGLVTGLKVGTATITVTTKSTVSKGGQPVAKTITVTVNMKTISDITKAGTYDVKGVVVALTTKGFLLHDGTAGIYSYVGSAPTYSIGDYLEISEKLTDSSTSPYQPYNGFYQFTSGATITKLTDAAPAVPEAVALTKAVADGWATATSFTPTAIQKYKWTSYAAKVGTSNFVSLNFADSTTLIEGTYTPTNLKPTAGNKYEVEGYFYGYSSSSAYAAFALTKLTQVFDPVTSITVKAAGDATWTRVGETLALSATIAPVTADPELVWSSSDTTKADIDANGKVTGKAIATGVIFTATSKSDSTKSGSITLDVHAENKTPVTQLDINEGTAYSLPIGRTKTFGTTVLPAEAKQDVTWSTSDDKIATVSATGVVTPVAVGTVNITAKTVGLDNSDQPISKTVALAVTATAETSEVAIKDALAMTQACSNGTQNDERFIKVTGLLERVSFIDDKVATCYITDLATQTSVRIVGATDSSTSLSYSTTTGIISFSDPKKAGTNLASYSNEQKVVFVGQAFRGDDGVAGLRGYFVSHEDSTQTYTASVIESEYGTGVLSKSTEITYGSFVSLTVTPKTGYETKVVYLVDGTGFKNTCSSNHAHPDAWQCSMGMVNHFLVVYGPTTDTSLELNTTILNLGSSSGSGVREIRLSGSWYKIEFANCANRSTGIMMTTNPSSIYNDDALPGYITKVQFVWNAASAEGVKNMVFSLGNQSAISAVPTDETNAFGTETTELSFDASYKYTYFQLAHLAAVPSDMYLDSIVLTFTAI